MPNLVKKQGEKIPAEKIKVISTRFNLINKAISREFWLPDSDFRHSMYVGSYGRNTAISSSDIDILVELPIDLLPQYENLSGNVQSRLLQIVKDSLVITYSRSDVRADGQVVKIAFSDDTSFEIVPAFKDSSGKYIYPDTNKGGRWRSTNPKAEQEAMFQKNRESNGLLNDTCKHIRSIRDNYFSSYRLSGIVIDSFVYHAIGNWKWMNSEGCMGTRSDQYERVLLNYFYRSKVCDGYSIYAPGSLDIVQTRSSCECLEKILKHIAC